MDNDNEDSDDSGDSADYNDVACMPCARVGSNRKRQSLTGIQGRLGPSDRLQEGGEDEKMRGEGQMELTKMLAWLAE